MDVYKEHETLGFSSIVSFAGECHNLHPDETREFVRVGKALRHLPLVREAALAGKLTFRHLKSFDYAIRVVDLDATVESQGDLLVLAAHVSAEEFQANLRRMREATLDQLDDAWRRGMNRQDLFLSKTVDGWQLAGFLPIHVGAKLRTVLDSASVPREAGDRRAPSARRIEALENVCDAILENGLPASNGIKPHLRVIVDVDDDQTNAKLEKFGPIGPALVAHLACQADWLTIKTRNHDVLDVGRRHRFATAKQTEAILHRQDGTCAGSGCRHPVAHIHHKTPWSFGGRTDLDDLIGYCNKCHTLEHQRMRVQPELARAG